MATRRSLFVFTTVFTLVSSLLVGSPASAQPSDNAARQRVIVVFHDGVADSRATARDVARRHEGRLELVYEHVLKGAAMEVPRRAIPGIERDRRVDYVEPDRVVAADELPTGVDRVEADQQATAAIDGGATALDVDIAILDTGIDRDHPDLHVVDGTDCTVGSSRNPECSDGTFADGHGHGTHVAGTAAAVDDGAGVVGVAPGARLWGVKVLDDSGSGYLSWVAAGIDWVAAQDADGDGLSDLEVANMSLGCDCSSTTLDTAIAGAVDRGVVFAVAAGNGGKDARDHSPANHPEVIAVSAIADFDGLAGGAADPTCRDDAGDDDTFASFSNYGEVVDLAAPGVCIRSTAPGGGYLLMSGTSASSPHAAGAAALYVVENAIAPSADRWSAVLAGLTGSGWSVPQSDTCGFTGGKSDEPLLMLAGCEVVGVVGEPPIASDVSATADEDTATTMTLSATDTETCELSFAIVDDPDNGTVGSMTDATCVSGTPNGDTATVTYTPVADYAGDDAFTYSVTDADGNTATATAAITVTAVNDAPVASDDTASTTTDRAVTIAVLDNDADVDGDALSVTSVTAPTSGAAVANADGTVTYTPDPGFAGTDTFDYTASDGSGASDTAAVTVTVDEVVLEMHVGDLDSVSENLGNQWRPVVAITVHDAVDEPVAGVTVTGTWSGRASGTQTCTTGSDGRCSIADDATFHKKNGEVTFTVDDLAHPDRTYAAGGNHDVDGSSDGTRIAVTK